MTYYNLTTTSIFSNPRLHMGYCTACFHNEDAYSTPATLNGRSQQNPSENARRQACGICENIFLVHSFDYTIQDVDLQINKQVWTYHRMMRGEQGRWNNASRRQCLHSTGDGVLNIEHLYYSVLCREIESDASQSLVSIRKMGQDGIPPIINCIVRATSRSNCTDIQKINAKYVISAVFIQKG